MTVDEVVKLVLAISFAFSMLGVSFQLMKLLGRLSDVVSDLRGAVKNVVSLSDMATSDYSEFRGEIRDILNMVKLIKDVVLKPLMQLVGIFGGISQVTKTVSNLTKDVKTSSKSKKDKSAVNEE